MADQNENLSIGLFSEVLAVEQLLRSKISKVLPKGMELSHFMVLNHLANLGTERSPAQLADAFNLTRGAMTNTLAKLEWSGFVHIRPDWDDARRKQVVISPAGKAARDEAFSKFAPLLTDAATSSGQMDLRDVVSALRGIRQNLNSKG